RPTVVGVGVRQQTTLSKPLRIEGTEIRVYQLLVVRGIGCRVLLIGPALVAWPARVEKQPIREWFITGSVVQQPVAVKPGQRVGAAAGEVSGRVNRSHRQVVAVCRGVSQPRERGPRIDNIMINRCRLEDRHGADLASGPGDSRDFAAG